MINENELTKSICKDSYYYFLLEFWDVIITEPIQDNWHIKYLCDELQIVGEQIIKRKPKLYDLIINIPPAESKSTICTILFPVWLWIKDPSLRIISGSYSSSLSIEHASKSRDVIKSDKFISLFNHFSIRRDSDNKSFYSNDKKGERKAVSTGGAVTGSHAHLLLIDDPINPKQSNSETLLKTANKWISETLPTRKVDAAITPTILIMQRLNELDPTQLMLDEKEKGGKIKHICLPADSSFPVKPSILKSNYIDGLMNPLRKNKDVLDDFKRKMGSLMFAAQMGQQPAPMEGNLIKKEWFQYYDKSNLIKDILNENITVYFYLDSAYDEKSDRGNDPSALMAFIRKDNNLYILECIETWQTFPDLIKFIPTFCNRNMSTKSSTLYIEPKATGISIYQVLRKSNINIRVRKDNAPKDSKLVRLTSQTPIIEDLRVYLPTGENWTESFITQCVTFPNSKHDDMVDCLSASIKIWKRLRIKTKSSTI